MAFFFSPISSWPRILTEPVILAEAGSRPIAARNVTDFPEPLSPTIPSNSPSRTVVSTPRTACTSPDSVGKRDVQILDLEDGRAFGDVVVRLGLGEWSEDLAVGAQVDRRHARSRLALGSNASRKPSPMKLMHTTVMTSARHGNRTFHQYPGRIDSGASAMRSPHVASPLPRWAP